jgi:hypothetical protein
MKTFTRWLGALLLVATPVIMMVAIDFASANTELVPASRLVAPFVSVTATRPTFLLLTNATTKELLGTQSATVDGSIHLEFYNKSCTRTDRSIHLSHFDIDQIDVVATDLAAGQTVGFVDIDVRDGDSAVSTSIQQNALMGTVVITDTVADFALSYPMAASIGSARGGVGNDIVTRNAASGLADVWSGRYEAFPTTVMVPGYYAEGGTGGGAITESLLAIASPADGNWYGGNLGLGEAPGQVLTTATALINMPTISVYDGCQQSISRNISGHYIADSLVTLLSVQLNRDQSTPAPLGWTAGKCGIQFGGLDELSGAPVGWVNLPNISCVRSANHNVVATSTCAGASGLPGSGSTGLAKIRGVVGILFEVTQVTGALPRAGADVTRLWGDPSTIYNQIGCKTSDGGNTDVRIGTGSPVATGCSYNMYPIQTTP